MDTVATLAALPAPAAPVAGERPQVKKKPQSIQISAAMKNYLHELGRMGDSYEDVIWKEVARADAYEAAYRALTWDCMDIHVLQRHLLSLAGKGVPGVMSGVVSHVPSAPFEGDILEKYPYLLAVDHAGNALVFGDERQRVTDLKVVLLSSPEEN